MTASSRVIWNGAISFGLVNIPVALHTATSDSGLDFDWLDKRTLDPVGYKRINKKTGEEIQSENIVRGLAYEKEHYVVLTDEEIRHALPKSTQTIEIEAFVSAAEIPLVYFERPYYLEPISRADKAYALLRETLLKTQRIGIAKVVIHTKQHLAAVIPAGPALILVLLRWASQIRSASELHLPPVGAEAAGLTERELAMASQLVESMATPWEPEKFTDVFTAEVMTLVEQKVKLGQTASVLHTEVEEPSIPTAEIIDFTDLLRRSLQREKNTDKDKAKVKTAKH